MQSISPTGLSSIVNNSDFFKRKSEIGLYKSWQNYYSEHTYISKQEPIYLCCPSSNWNRNFFLPTTYWTHTTTSFLILMITPFLVLSYISVTFVFNTKLSPIPIFLHFTYFIYLLVATTGKLMVYLDGCVG